MHITLNPETIIAKPEGTNETTQTQGEANAPSFLVNNPWLYMIRRRS